MLLLNLVERQCQLLRQHREMVLHRPLGMEHQHLRVVEVARLLPSEMVRQRPQEVEVVPCLQLEMERRHLQEVRQWQPRVLERRHQ